MDSIKWTETAQALAAIGGLIVTVVGFLLVIRQVRQLERALRSDTNANLCSQSIDILREMSQCPASYKCFYNNEPLPADEATRIRVSCICEMIANYLDHVALQRDNLPHAVWERWRLFICETIHGSQVIRDHFAQFRNWYSPEVLRHVDEVCGSDGEGWKTFRPAHPAAAPHLQRAGVRLKEFVQRVRRDS